MRNWIAVFSVIVAIATFDGHARAAPVTRNGALAASKSITSGSWNILFDDGTSRRMCLTDIQPLLQLAHAGPVCGRLVIDDEPNRSTVHYTCSGAGWGRTTILVETARLVRINSQGIAGKVPFAFDAEARRTGACDDSSLRRPH